jgi:hypothetical protein
MFYVFNFAKLSLKINHGQGTGFSNAMLSTNLGRCCAPMLFSL